MKISTETVEKILKWLILIPFACIIFFLAVVSIFGSCYVNSDEYSYFVTDYALINIAIFILSVLGIMGIQKIVSKKQIFRKDLLWKGVLIFYAISLLCIVLYVQVEPRADQEGIVREALKLLNHDYSGFNKGGYLEMYPNQIGVVSFFALILKIFPFGNNCFRILNVVSLVVTVIYFSKLGRICIKGEKEQQYTTGICVLLFLPISMYVTFIYGTLIGMAFSIAGLYYAYCFLQNQKYRYFIYSAVLLALSVLIKENYIIPVIGIILYFLFYFFKTRNKRFVFGIACIICATVGLSKIVSLGTTVYSGRDLSGGMPTTAWIAMGLQEGYLSCGWYNGYNYHTYIENNNDTKVTNEEALASIKNSVNQFINNPASALKFFFKKTVSQWNNPTFQCFWINDLVTREKDNIQIKSVSNFWESFLGEPGNRIAKEYMNLFQTCILMGVLVWIVLRKDNIGVNDLLLAVIFLGGFFFHLLWEAKCQYTMPYFMLLFPYAIQGYSVLTMKLKTMRVNVQDKKEDVKKSGVMIIGVMLLCLALISVIGSKYVDKALGFGTERYYNYVKNCK